MKQQSGQAFFSLSAAAMPNTNFELSETQNGEFNRSQQKIFSSADLWNIQRQRRSMVQRRFSF